MSTDTVSLFLRHLALSEETSRLSSSSDRDLLAAYEAGRGQAAFSELMRRHGPMVLRTCRRVLGRHPDAEDAFQATFVLLARKAHRLQAESDGSLSLGGWLHRVAYRTSLNALTGATRRRVRERQAPAMTHPQPDPVNEATWNEVRPILDAELDALPESARRLLVACYLQGKTHAEAAAELDLPAGSVAWRLGKARALLAARLARRGIAVTASVLAVLLGGMAEGAGVPAVLMVHSIEAAVTLPKDAAAVVSPKVAGLVQSGLAKMTGGSARLGIALAGWVGLLGAGLIAFQTLKAQPEADPEAEAAALAEQAMSGPDQPPDRFGDPLPRGALARLGTIRLRVPSEGENCFLFTRDGRGVITGGASGPTRQWDAATGKLIRQFGDGSRKHVQALALSPDGRMLVARGGPEGGLLVWDFATGKLVAEGKGELASSISLAISPDGRLVASAGTDRKLRLWDSVNGVTLWSRPVNADNLTALAFSPDGKTIWAVGSENVSVWDVSAANKEARRWESGRRFGQVAIAPDARVLAVASLPPGKAAVRDHVVHLVDLATLKEIRQLATEPEVGDRGILSLALEPGGKVLATNNGVGETRLFDTATGKELRRCLGEPNYAGAMTFSADGTKLAAMDRGLVRLWETASGKELAVARVGHKQLVSTLAFTPDGRSLFSASWDGTVRVWDPASGEERRHLSPRGADLDGYHLAGLASAVAGDGVLTTASLALKKFESFGVAVCRWEQDGTREIGHTLQDLGTNWPQSVVLSPDGKTVAYAAGNGHEPEVCLRDAATWTLLHKIPGGYPAFSPDGKTLVTGSSGPKKPGAFALWETATGRQICSASLAAGGLYLAAFSPDGKTLVTVSHATDATYTTIQLWPIPSAGSPAPRLGPPRVLAQGLKSWVWALAFSSDGRTLALPGDNNTVRVLEIATGKERAHFAGHLGSVRSLAFSPDDRSLASGSLDTTILLWDMTGRPRGGRPGPPSAKERDELWADLAGDDAVRAGRAVWALADDPARTVPYVTELVRSATRLTPEVAARLIRDLDSDAYAVRTRAQRDLERSGASAEAALRRARETAPSLEVRKRVEDLLAAVEEQRKSPSGDVVREMRAVEVLERAGTPEARRAIKALAAGEPDSSLTREARAALDRLERTQKR